MTPIVISNWRAVSLVGGGGWWVWVTEWKNIISHGVSFFIKMKVPAFIPVSNAPQIPADIVKTA